MQATKTSSSFEVTTDGVGVVGHAGAALLRELADRVGPIWALGWQRPGGRLGSPNWIPRWIGVAGHALGGE